MRFRIWDLLLPLFWESSAMGEASGTVAFAWQLGGASAAEPGLQTPAIEAAENSNRWAGPLDSLNVAPIDSKNSRAGLFFAVEVKSIRKRSSPRSRATSDRRASIRCSTRL